MKKRPDDEQIKELHHLMEDWAHRHGFGTSELLAFMSAAMVGTMLMVGYDKTFANATFDRMKMNYEKRFNESE